MYIQNCVIISFIFVGVYLIFTSFFLKFCFTAYYYEFRGGPPEYCLTRQDLINRINHFEFQYVLLPTIWIDEDLELSCNELPATWIPAMTRKSQNPYYSIKSFQSNQTYTFTLDTSNCESDNCPGFAFENIKLNLKGNNLNTTAFYINKNVNISIENDDFSLNVDIAKLTMFQLSLFSKFSFSQLTLEDNLEDFSLDDESNQTLPEKNYKFGNIYIENSFCEPNYLYFPVLLDTNVTFAEDYLYIEMNERSDLVIHLPIFDYSNGFYFNIQKSNINFFVQGNINYSCQFPHSFYLIQNKESKNVNISIGKGNFLSTVGIFYDDSSGSLFSTTLHDCNLYYYNENKIDSLSLYNVQFYAYTSIEIESTFTFSGNIPVQTNLNLSCSYINVINSDYEFSQLMAVKGKNINVTVNYINSCSHIIGDVYLRKGIKVPNSASSITIQNLYFIDHPAVELSYLWGSNSECPINITGNIFGNANIVPMTSTKEFIKYICGNAVDESFFNISYIGTTIQHIPFEILKIDNCIVTNQTSAKPAESIVICFDGPSNKCPKTYNVLPENDDDWSIYYTPYLTKIEFNMMRDVMIDLSVIKHELSVIFQPYVPIFQVSPGYEIKIASSQRAANYILNWQLGSTTVANVMTITFMNYLSMKNIITIQKSLKYDPKNFKMMLDFYELTYLAIEYMSQINDLSDILPSIPCLIVNSKEIIINIEYTNDGWSIGTSTENYTVNGFYHSNFTLQITKYSSSYKRLVVSVNANNPYLMYLMIEYGSTLSNIVQLAGDWKPFQMICPLILGGTLTLEIPFDFIPINLDDRIQYIFHIIRREIALNITGVYAKNQVMTIYSIVYMNYCQLITFSHSQSEIISIIFMENVDSIRAISSSSSNEIKFIFRKLLIIDNSLVRFWSESSEIKITGEGELLNPTFRDSIVLIWDYLKNDNRWKAPTIKAADSLVRCKFIIQEQKANFSDEDVNQMKHFYFVMAASSDLTLDEFNDKIEFESDSLELKFENRSIKFETFICYMMDFEPDIFTENGIVESENALSLGFYLRRIDDIVENENKTILSQGLSNSQITVISFGVTSFILILVIVIIAIIYRQKNRIDRLLENK